LCGYASAIQLGYNVAFLYQRALRHQRRDLRLPRLGLLHIGRPLDLHELAGAELTGGGDEDLELAALDARDEGVVSLCGGGDQEPGERASDENDRARGEEPAFGQESHWCSSGCPNGIARRAEGERAEC